MRRLLLGLVTALLLASPAQAAPKKPLVVGTNGQASQIGADTTLQTSAPSVSAASINLPQGTAPSAPNNGDCWMSSEGLSCRVAGVTMGPFLDMPATEVTAVSPKFCPYNQLTGLPANDNTACVQAAINYACASANSRAGQTGGFLVFGKGKYYLKGVTIPSTCPNLYPRGQGITTTIVSDEGCTGPIFDFYPDATQNYVYGGGVSDLNLFNNKLFGGVFNGTTSCQFPLIRSSYGRNMVFQRISSLSPKILVKAIGGLVPVVRDVWVDQALAGSTGVLEFMGSGATPASGQGTRQDGATVDNVTMFAAPANPGQQWYVGIWNHGFSQTLRITKAAFQSTSTALKVDCTNPGVSAPLLATTIDACPGNSYVYDLEGECAGSNCVDMEDTYSWYFQTLYGACLARTSTANPPTSGCNNSLRIRNNQFTRTGTISVLGGQLNNAQGSCVEISGWQVTISGVNLYGCNAANVGGSDVTIAAPSGANLSGSNSIVNNRMCTGPANNSSGETGVNIIAGSDYNDVSHNNWKGCGAGIIGTPGAHSVTTPNVGP